MPNTHKDTIDTALLIDGTEIMGMDLDSIPIPDGEYDKKNVSTTRAGVFTRYAPNMYDTGECEIAGLLIPGDPGQEALKEAFYDRQEHLIQVVLTESGVTFEYWATVMKYLPDSDDNTAKFSSKLLASGPFTMTTTKAGVTKIEATASGAITCPLLAKTAYPTDTGTVVFVELTATTSDTFKVTAATASYIGWTEDGGSTWHTLTSGTASGSVTFGAAGTNKEILVRIEETDKATRFIKVIFCRQ